MDVLKRQGSVISAHTCSWGGFWDRVAMRSGLGGGALVGCSTFTLMPQWCSLLVASCSIEQAT